MITEEQVVGFKAALGQKPGLDGNKRHGIESLVHYRVHSAHGRERQ
jgi:hypothetical protein